ncbi:MAG: HAD family phosphatase [Thiogranum sp.]|jgi:putative hydrolase of the HAD superfamily|nr:HAD family phosphatase [Thiogranum sp.]
MSGIQAVLFDFGGVLAEEGFSHVLESLAEQQGLQVQDMTAAGARAVYDSGFVLGRATESEFWSLLRQRTGLRGDDAALTAKILSGFTVRPWMRELVQRLRAQGYVTGILSDQTDWLDRLDSRQHFYRLFDRIYNSYYLGKGKRDPSLFSDVAADLGLPPASILFVDDSAGNVARAAAAGMQTIQYVDRETFLKALEASLR